MTEPFFAVRMKKTAVESLAGLMTRDTLISKITLMGRRPDVRYYKGEFYSVSNQSYLLLTLVNTMAVMLVLAVLLAVSLPSSRK
jgi:hypothetical protein